MRTLIVSDNPVDFPWIENAQSLLVNVLEGAGDRCGRWQLAPSMDVQKPDGYSSLRAEVDDTDSLVLIASVRDNTWSGTIDLALDHLGAGLLSRKPVGLVAIGSAQGSRAIDHLRVVMAGLDAVVIPQALFLGEEELRSTELRKRAHGFVADLSWFAARLSPGAGHSKPDQEEDQGGLVSSRIDRAASYIRENYADSTLSLDMAAREAYMSRYHFSRTFKKHTGRGFIDFVTDLRMEQARFLLADTSLSVSEISGRIGYQDSGHFQRTFKNLIGLSPSAYRLRGVGQAMDGV